MTPDQKYKRSKKGKAADKRYGQSKKGQRTYHRYDHSEKGRKRDKARNSRLKILILSHYGLVCPCGFSDLRALSIDHIAGDGAAHRREIGAGAALYRFLKKNNFPPGFQTLCMNCQWIKRFQNGEHRKA
jgi:hypothetical protein